MIDPTFPETCVVLIDAVRLSPGIAHSYHKFVSGEKLGKCRFGKTIARGKNFLEGKVCMVIKKLLLDGTGNTVTS